MKFGGDWKRIHATNLENQQVWRDREVASQARGMTQLFERFSTRPNEYRRHWNRARCRLCQWEGPVSVAGRHAQRYHPDRVFDLKIIGVLERWYVKPETK